MTTGESSSRSLLEKEYPKNKIEQTGTDKIPEKNTNKELDGQQLPPNLNNSNNNSILTGSLSNEQYEKSAGGVNNYNLLINSNSGLGPQVCEPMFYFRNIQNLNLAGLNPALANYYQNLNNFNMPYNPINYSQADLLYMLSMNHNYSIPMANRNFPS